MDLIEEEVVTTVVLQIITNQTQQQQQIVQTKENGEQVVLQPLSQNAHTIQLAASDQLQIVSFPAASLESDGQFVVQPANPQTNVNHNPVFEASLELGNSYQSASGIPTFIHINGDIFLLLSVSSSNPSSSTAPAAATISQVLQSKNEISNSSEDNLITTVGDESDQPQMAPLYVNAKQYERILKRRQARAKLRDEGRIPEFRSRYLDKTQRNNAMNRKKGKGARFCPGSSKLKEPNTTSDDNSEHDPVVDVSQNITFEQLWSTYLGTTVEDVDLPDLDDLLNDL